MIRLLTAATVLTLVCGASATTIDFESLQHSDTEMIRVGRMYTEDGFLLSTDGGGGFYTFGTEDYRFPGSTALFDNETLRETTLRKEDFSSFSFNSIRLSELNGSFGASVTFVGTFAAGGTISQTVNLDGVFGFETFTFSGFDDVTSVAWSQLPGYHQFDDIVVDSGTSQALPDGGGTLWMLGGSMVLLGMLRCGSTTKEPMIN